MSLSSIIGSLGVSLLLIAFFLSLFRYISQENKVYMLLNIAGAALSCYASVLISYIPFVILEAVWCLVALAALMRSMSTPGPTGQATPRIVKADRGPQALPGEKVKKGNPPGY